MTPSKLILIAVSDTFLAESLAASAKEKGIRAVVVDNGNDALLKMKELHPDLLISDIVLSGMDGYDLLAAKSFDKNITKIPVIVVSNMGLPVDMKRLPTVGIREYFIKTHIDPDEVIGKVCSILGFEPSDLSTVKTKKPVKILWAEDDRFLSDILSKKFLAHGYNILKANNGTEALAIAETETPDIIILDIIMPDINGFDVLQKLKMQEKFKKTPVIMLSNLSAPSDFEKSKKLGAVGFIVKAAVSLDEIVAQVEKLVR
jgi:DNA-binding response OmpR family regulator